MTWCDLAGHNTHWIKIDQYLVCICRRCPHIVAVVSQRERGEHWPLGQEAW